MKNISRFIFAAILFISIFTVNVLHTYCLTETHNVWNGEAASSFSRGNGSRKDPYIIESACELAYFRDCVNSGKTYKGKYIKLENDIDLCGKNWSPIGTISLNNSNLLFKSFEGDFNGQDKIINNFIIDDNTLEAVGLFGVTGPMSNIHNLKIGDNTNICGNENVGAFTGIGLGKLCKCTSLASIVGHSMVGGIAGYCLGEINNCKSYGTISGKDLCIGGICGYTGNVVANCTNNSTVISEYACKMGGITGYSDGYIINCINYGNVSSKKGSYIGGISGVNYKDVSNCLSCASITGDMFTAGIVGLNNGYDNCTLNSKIKNCYWNKDLYDGQGVYSSTKDIIENVCSVSSENIKEKAFIDILNNNVDIYNKSIKFVYMNYWEQGENLLPAIGRNEPSIIKLRNNY